MSDLAGEKYIADLDHYLTGVDYHVWMSRRVDLQLLDSVPKDYIDNYMESKKYQIVGSLVEAVKDKIIYDCTVTEETFVHEIPAVEYKTDIWLFSRKELEQFKEEVRAEALSGR